MKAALLQGIRNIVIDEVPVPAITDDDALVKVEYCGICGSEFPMFLEGEHTGQSWIGGYLGHEPAGVISKLGRNVKGLKVGDRVTIWPIAICGECYQCKMGNPHLCEHTYEVFFPIGAPNNKGYFAEYCLVTAPEKRLFKLPDDVSLELGAMAEPIACSMKGVRRAGLKWGDNTMVIGCGPIGLAVVALLKRAGAGLIIATEYMNKRMELAKKFGADYVFDPRKEPNLKEKVRELTKGRGVDKLFSCAGTQESWKGITGFLTKGGEITILDCTEHPVGGIIPDHWVYGEWAMRGSVCYDFNDYPLAIEFMKREPALLGEMITKKIKLRDIQKEGFEVLISPNHNEVKILVEPE